MAEEDGVVIPATQTSSSVSYKWVIVFGWELKFENPFSVYPMSQFKDSEDFPKELITGPLTDLDRSDRFKIASVNARSTSIFAKIQEGKQLLHICKSVRDLYIITYLCMLIRSVMIAC